MQSLDDMVLPISLDEETAHHLNRYMEEHSIVGHGLRISAEKGSLFRRSYQLSFQDLSALNERDMLYEQYNLSIVIDRGDIERVRGCELIYNEARDIFMLTYQGIRGSPGFKSGSGQL